MFHNRQGLTDDPLDSPDAVPGADGLSGTKVANEDGTTATDLKFNTEAATNPVGTAPNFATQIPPITTGNPPEPTSTPGTTQEQVDEPTASAASSAASRSGISMGTVIGVCFGAFAGAVILIFLAVWWYKKSGRAMKQRQKRQWHGGDHGRSRSRAENWNRLDSGDEDKWAGMMQEDPKAKEMVTRSPSEKLSLFKKDSVKTMKTATTERAELPPILTFDHPFASPDIMPQRSIDQGSTSAYEASPPGPISSWADNASASDSFVTLRPNISDRAMSPTVNSALRTPTVTASEHHQHQWESAEVVHLDQDGDFEERDIDNRSGVSNPFHSLQDEEHLPVRAHSKQPTNPFISVSEAEIPASPPDSRAHLAHLSVASDASNDRAIQSLIAVLDRSIPPMPSRDLDTHSIRPASMQPSFVSVPSMYGSVYDPEDMADSFPTPPQGRQ
jgi:hypothetical protein